jgi:hypothetical protein
MTSATVFLAVFAVLFAPGLGGSGDFPAEHTPVE